MDAKTEVRFQLFYVAIEDVRLHRSFYLSMPLLCDYLPCHAASMHGMHGVQQLSSSPRKAAAPNQKLNAALEKGKRCRLLR